MVRNLVTRVLIAVLLVAGLLITGLSAPGVGTSFAGAGTALEVASGQASFVSGSTVLAYRLQSYSLGSPSMYVGVADLGVGSNRSGALYLSEGSGSPYAVTFSSDGSTGDSGTATPTGASTATATYPVSPFPTNLNTAQISVNAVTGETVSFSGITLNGETIPDLSATGGQQTICVSDLSLSSFTFSGTFTRPDDQKNSRNKLDIQVGDGTCSQTIDFTSTAPTGAYCRRRYLCRLSDRGASGNPVVLSVDPSAASVCSLAADGKTVSFTGCRHLCHRRQPGGRFRVLGRSRSPAVPQCRPRHHLPVR